MRAGWSLSLDYGDESRPWLLHGMILGYADPRDLALARWAWDEVLLRRGPRITSFVHHGTHATVGARLTREQALRITEGGEDPADVLMPALVVRVLAAEELMAR